MNTVDRKTYVIDLKEISNNTDTKKAGCGDRLFYVLVYGITTHTNRPVELIL